MNAIRRQIQSMLRVEPRAGGFRARFTVGPDLAILPDHFRDSAILPGVCMVQAELLADPPPPRPLVVPPQPRIRFSDVDPRAILWHGRSAQLFEQANEELGRLCGMSYPDFRRERLLAPIVQLHVDYFAPVTLGEQVTIT